MKHKQQDYHQYMVYIQQYDIIYTAVLVFPNGLPNSLQEDVMVNIWITTSGDDEKKKYGDKATIHRWYSHNYVESLLDFTNLPDYQENIQ